jgi:hypothetical protein
MTDAREIIRNLRYEPYDPERPTAGQRALEDRLDHLYAFHELKDADWLSVSGFDCFAMMAARPWPRLCYESHLLEGGLMFWMTDVHADAVGRALRPGLKALRLDLTRPERDGFTVMAGAVAPDVTVPELFVVHVSGDEIGVVEARGIARLATRLACGTLHLWAGAFDEGALDALADELGALGNGDLRTTDVCDTSKKEPADRVSHPGLSALARKNKKNKRR